MYFKRGWWRICEVSSSFLLSLLSPALWASIWLIVRRMGNLQYRAMLSPSICTAIASRTLPTLTPLIESCRNISSAFYSLHLALAFTNITANLRSPSPTKDPESSLLPLLPSPLDGLFSAPKPLFSPTQSEFPFNSATNTKEIPNGRASAALFYPFHKSIRTGTARLYICNNFLISVELIMSPITFAARFTGRTRDGVTYWSVDVDQNDKTASETENRQSFDSTSAEQDLPQSEGSDPLPKPLRKVSLQQRLEAFALACLPIPFIGILHIQQVGFSWLTNLKAMVIGAFLLNNKPQSHRGSYFIQASRLGPTIYPLVFAGIAGKFLRTIALYKAQKGSTLGVSAAKNVLLYASSRTHKLQR